MKTIQSLLFAISVTLVSCFSSALATPLIVGSYDLPRMKSIKPLTFPRLHLYDVRGNLVERNMWPKELDSLKATAGEAYCCISDSPSPPGHVGPPPNCKKVTYGADIAEHFKGLRDKDQNLISYSDLPKHKYLLVEYFASWCAPCIPARGAMEKFLSSPEGDLYVAVAIDFTRLVTEK